MTGEPLPDDLDRKIIRELTKDARTSVREMARRLGVSAPTISHRVRRMEETGFIVAYRVVTAADPPGVGVKKPGWPCAHCRKEIRAGASVRSIAGKHLAFCCETCAALYTDRYERLARGATT